MIVWYYGLLDSIITNRSSLFIFKFLLLLCYYPVIKCKLFTAFYLQIDSQTKLQNSIMKAYFWVFVNLQQNDWARSLLIAKFFYNNRKNDNTGHIVFELNCGYHPCLFFKKNINSCFNQKRPKNYQANQETWWLFVPKTSIIVKSFRSQLTIKALSLKAT